MAQTLTMVNRREVRTWATKTVPPWNIRSNSKNSKIQVSRGSALIHGVLEIWVKNKFNLI